jgi:hypothetical protein
MVEGFVLPEGTFAVAELVDAPGGGAFDCPQDLRQCVRPAAGISQCREKQVRVIGHNYSGVKMDCFEVVVKAVLECESSRRG